MNWPIFRSNMSGANQVYAVELNKADTAPGAPAKANREFN